MILASNFERVQIIPGAIHGYVRISSLDCSTDTGKIAAAYGAEVCIFEPTPLIHTAATTHVSKKLTTLNQYLFIFYLRGRSSIIILCTLF